MYTLLLSFDYFYSGTSEAGIHARVSHEKGAQETEAAKQARDVEGGAGKNSAGSGAAARAEVADLEPHASSGYRGGAGSHENRGTRSTADGQEAEGSRGRERGATTHRGATSREEGEEAQGGHQPRCTRSRL